MPQIVAIFQNLTGQKPAETASTPMGIEARIEAFRAKRDEITVKKEKVEQSRRRQEYRSLIQGADSASRQGELDKAIEEYLSVYKSLGEKDHALEEKIARTYLKKYDYARAADYLLRVPAAGMTERDRHDVVFAFLASDPARLPNIFGELRAGNSEMMLYRVLHACMGGGEPCIRAAAKAASGALTPTASGAEVPTAETESLNTIRTITQASTQAQDISPDGYYATVRVAAALLQAGWAPVAAQLAKEVATARPDYAAARRVAGYALVQMGRYTEANTHLQQLYLLEPNNKEVAVLLGMVYAELEDYVASNLYYNAAVLAGYTPKTDIERRMVYNASLLGDAKNLMKVLKYLLDEPDATVDDFRIAIWTATEENEPSKARLWLDKGLAKFPKDAMLLALGAWFSASRGEWAQTKEYTSKALRLEPKNPLALLALVKARMAEGDTSGARSLATEVVTLDTGLFGERAKSLIEQIDNPSTASGAIE